MSLVAFTQRAEKSLLDLLSKRLDHTLLVVDVRDEEEVHLSFKNEREIESLQQNVEMIGPFRIPLGERETTMFVRERDPASRAAYELDYYACGGRACFQLRATKE
jgi:hypothetical protein